MVKYFSEEWDGDIYNVFKNGCCGFTFLHDLLSGIDSIVRHYNGEKKNDYLPCIIYHLAETWIATHVQIFNEPIIKRGKSRQKADEARKENERKRHISWGEKIYNLRKFYLDKDHKPERAVSNAYKDFKINHKNIEQSPETPGLDKKSLNKYLKAYEKSILPHQ